MRKKTFDGLAYQKQQVINRDRMAAVAMKVAKDVCKMGYSPGETRGAIRAWLVENEPRQVPRFDDFTEDDGYITVDRLLRLAFKAGVDYGTAKAAELSGLLHRGEQNRGEPMAENLRMTPAALNAALSGDVENFLVAATPGGIEAQEAREQLKAVAAQRLPREGTILVDGRESPERRKMWESLGFVFGDAHDDLFVNVAFPAGWKLVATDHSMWSDLLDASGRKRAGMFYKGAFYDRTARINFVQADGSPATKTTSTPVKDTQTGKRVGKRVGKKGLK